jgi:hypothetical protein
MTTTEKENAPGGATKNHGEDTHFATQYETVYHSFKKCPKTMLETSVETGILRANICRYVAEMQRKGQIQIIRKGLCSYTKFKAGFFLLMKAYSQNQMFHS